LNAIRYRLANLRRSRSGTAAILKTGFVRWWLSNSTLFSEEERGHKDPSEASRLSGLAPNRKDYKTLHFDGTRSQGICYMNA
jgi:hypothetical protein